MTTLAELVDVIDRHNFVVLDTETTGLRNAEVCEIAVCSRLGDMHIDTLVHTQQPIPRQATDIHGITDEMVRHKPNWITMNKLLSHQLEGKDIVIYNADYDISVIENTCERWGIAKAERLSFADRTYCAMTAYAEFNGDWSDYHRNYSYVKLTTAYQRTVPNPKNAFRPHRASGDVMMTYLLCKELQKIMQSRQQ